MTKITVRFKVPGFHCWHDAPKRRDYLSERHRHLFGFRVTVPVRNNDREVEFHDLLAISKSSIDLFHSVNLGEKCFDPVYEFGSLGCEGIAEMLANTLCALLSRWCEVEVDEDGECSATVRKKPGRNRAEGRGGKLDEADDDS